MTGTLADWVADWVDAHLDVPRTGPLELVRQRPWGSVWTAPTEAGPMWLKQAAPSTTFEVRLYPVLARHVPDHVLHPLGVDADGRLVLLPDAGPSFAQRFRDDALAAAMVQALAAYGELQRHLSAAVGDDELLALGLVDMRPERMPQRFDEALAFAREYAATHGSAADRALVDDLAATRARFTDRCARLAGYGRPAALDHNDLHAANVVGEPDRPRFYDWGDAVLAHPFACLLTPLDTLPGGTEAVRAAYLAGFGDPTELADEARLARDVAIVARALVWVRALGERPAEQEHAHAPFAHLARLRDVLRRTGACDPDVRRRGSAQPNP